MLTYNINKQQLGSLSRLDPEYSRPEFLNLKLGECFLLGDLVEIKIGATLKKINESGDTYYIRTGDFKDAGIDFKNCLKGTFSQTRKVEQLRVDDILITRKGSVGRIEMVNDDFPEKTFISSEIFCLRVKDEGLIDPAYLAVFLASPLGQSQIKRLMSGISIFNIAKSELEKIKIIIGKNAEYVALKYRKVQGFLARFNVQYAYIEESLMKTIVMYETIKEKSFSFKIRISQVKKEDTLDPEFFKICDNVKNSILLGDIVEVKSGIEVGTASYRLNGRPFIRVGNITPCFLVNKDQKYISQELYDLYKNKYEPRLNDIILTKDGTPGMALVINESSKSIISSGMVRLVLKNKNFNPYYLALVLNSLIGQVKIKRLTGGSNIKHLKLSAIPKIEIPVMFNSFQEDIGNSLKDLLDLQKENIRLRELIYTIIKI